MCGIIFASWLVKIVGFHSSEFNQDHRNEELAMKKTAIFVCAATVICLGTAYGSPLFFTDELSFDTAHPGLPIIDFEGIASPGTLSSITPGFFSGVTFTAQDPKVASATFTNSNFPGTSPSDFFFEDRWGSSIGLTFAPDITAVGFNIALGTRGSTDSGGPVVLEVYNGLNLLETQNINVSGLSTFDSFAGFSHLGPLNDLSIIINSEDHWIALDNLRFSAIPEPSTLLLLGTGLIAAVGFGRRRK